MPRMTMLDEGLAKNLKRAAALTVRATIALCWMAGRSMAAEPEEAMAPVPMPEVVIRGERQARELFTQPRQVEASLAISQSVVDRAQLELQGARVLTDGVRYLPGTWTETRGRKVKTFVSYRGQMYPYPDFAWNGVWLPEFHEMPYLVPVTVLERMEITRSAASLFLGASGDAGVIDLIPRNPEGSARLMVRNASYGTGELSAFVPLSSEPGGLAVAAGYFHTSGPEGLHAEENVLHGMVSGQWRTGAAATLSMQLLALHANRQLMNARPPAGQRLQNTLERYEPFQALLAGLRLNYEHAAAATTSLGFVGAYRDHDFVNDGAGGHVTMREQDYSLTLDLTHARRLTDFNRLRVGAVYNHFAAPEGKRFIEGRRVDYDTMAMSIATEHLLGPALLDGGVRLSRRYLRDYAGFSIDGSSRGLENVEAVQGEWDKPRIRLTVGARWFATPTLELFAHAGGDRIQPRSGTLSVALEAPDAETRRTGELGLRYTFPGSAIFEFSGFAVQRRDGLLLDGATAITPAGRELELYRNQHFRQFGAEAGLRQIPLVPGLTAFANLTFVRSQAGETPGGYTRYVEIPAWLGAAGLDAQRDDWRLGVYLKTVSAYKSRRFSGDGDFKPLGDFADLQARLSRKLTNHNSLVLAVENLLDDPYSTVVGYPDSGRRYSLQLDMMR